METVEVFGQKYRLRSDEDEKHLRAVAAVVDRHMREVAGSLRVVSTEKVAVVTAMNFASQLERHQREVGARQAALTKRVDMLIKVVDRALAQSKDTSSEELSQKKTRARTTRKGKKSKK